MLRIVMDSAGDLPLDWLDTYDIQVIPINIHFGERTYFQGVDLSNADFYQLVEKSGTIPKTSQPTPQQFDSFYKKIAIPGDSIISIHVTSKLSGTYSSAEIAARDLHQVFDIGFMCKEAREMDRKGYGLKQILERLDYIRDRTEIVLTLDTLEYARMSGRVKALQAALASILKVKPIVVLNEGILDLTEKVRTRGRSLERIVDRMREKVGNRLVNLAIVHAQDPTIGEQLLERVKEIFNYKDLILTELSTGIAANLGPGTVGIVACPAVER